MAAEKLVANRYRLIGKKGESALSVVYHARDTILERDVALKVLKAGPGIDEHAKERFDAEARAAAGLVHPRIAAVYDVVETELGRTIVMEFVNGPSLAQRLAIAGTLPEAVAIQYARQIAEALGVAHARGMLHRDVKPGNVLLNENGDIKVVDFGLVKTLDGTAATITQSGMFVGTVQYVSPEQAEGKPLSPASDLYGLGIIIYQMIIGSVPYSGDSPLAIALAHINKPAPARKSLESAMSSGLAAIVARLLEKEPGKRFSSAAEVINALDNLGGEKAIVADSGARLEAPTIVAPLGVRAAVRRQRAAARVGTYVRRVHPVRAAIVTGTILLTAIFLALASSPTVVVADVRGKSAGAARATLARNGLHVMLQTKPNLEAKAGTVVTQSPRAGSHVYRGSTVALIASSGTPMVSVPEFRGMQLATARAALHRVNLLARLGAVYSSATPYTIVDQAPSPGTPVRARSTIMVVFAIPPPAAPMPFYGPAPRHGKGKHHKGGEGD